MCHFCCAKLEYNIFLSVYYLSYVSPTERVWHKVVPGARREPRDSRWPPKCLGPHRHSSKKGCFRRQAMNLVPLRRVRVWGNSLGCLFFYLSFSVFSFLLYILFNLSASAFLFFSVYFSLPLFLFFNTTLSLHFELLLFLQRFSLSFISYLSFSVSHSALSFSPHFFFKIILLYRHIGFSLSLSLSVCLSLSLSLSYTLFFFFLLFSSLFSLLDFTLFSFFTFTQFKCHFNDLNAWKQSNVNLWTMTWQSWIFAKTIYIYIYIYIYIPIK